VLIHISGAEENIHKLPTSGATADDLIRVAEDLLDLMDKNPQAESFKTMATEALGNRLTAAKKETAEALAALPAESLAREAYSEASMKANDILVRVLDIVRGIFGPKSPEYKQFMERTYQEEEEIDAESLVGEES
jgi:hypothetical protein